VPEILEREEAVFNATADKIMPTALIGSLPRPSWYTATLGPRSFLDAMVHAPYREHYTDAVGMYLHDQDVAGLDILTDGDARFDHDVGGQSWARYPLFHMAGLDHDNPVPAERGSAGVLFERGHILHDYLEARVTPSITGPVGPGNLQYAELWKTAQRLTRKPVKFGTITPELVAYLVRDNHYKSLRERIWAFSDAFNEELHRLADAGCPLIQMEEPQIHLMAIRGIVEGEINVDFMVDVFNNTVRGLRDKTEVWCHSCWGNPSQQRMFAEVQSYKPALEAMNRVDADVITFETCSSGGIDLEAIGDVIDTMKIGIGVIDHHTLQVESPDQVAGLLRHAIEHIPAERLVVVSDCGMGREGMSRRHAFYKAVSLVLGTNIVRREIGAPEAECLAADPKYSLVP
jgi:5-methyltetrahydropteroyltriglutamate--homocysteine methyltransferase